MANVDEHESDADVELTSAPVEDENVKAWEQIDVGRYKPRRIRGSMRGRELG